MVFSSTVFLFAFLPLTLLGYYLIDRRFKNYFLLAVSLFFYAWGEPRFVFVMLGAILMNHVLALLIDRSLKSSSSTGNSKYQKRAKGYLWLTVILNLALFFVYKYLNFTIANLNAVGGLFGLTPLSQTSIALPIGISFFTFQAMSYVFDVYRGKGQVQKNPLNTALYVSLFPQLIAGPIVRYETVAQEINHRQETLEDFAQGVRRFIQGLAKKVILSNSLAVLADQAFDSANYAQLSVVMAWLGAIAYTLQIYFDFSGYSDMAIGLGRMFGFHFEENFRYPYISKSISEFWRRWHISLGSWFRDYIYFPLGGSRVKTKGRLVFNLFVVWFLTGVWHGAAWNFILWGLMYFVLITFEKLTGLPGKLPQRWMRGVYQVFTLLAVVLGWVLFRAEGLGNALGYLGCMFGLMGNAPVDAGSVFLLGNSAVLLAVSILFSLPLASALGGVERRIGAPRSSLAALVRELVVFLAYMAVFAVAISFTVSSTYDPFIYFNF